MRDRIRKRLTEYRAEALHKIAVAVTRRRSEASGTGTLHGSRINIFINEDTKIGFAEYMDQSVKFIRRAAPGSSAEYVDELWDGGHKLKQEIMANTKSEFRGQLSEALEKLIERKVEDFELGYVEGKDMTATTNNTVNIINSNISQSVVQITQSGKDAISKDTALKLKELVNSEEIKGLPDDEQLDVLDQANAVINELSAPVTDDGKVVRGLKRLGKFLSEVASQSVSKLVAELAVAYAKAHGLA
jgi:hypothetical protein